MLSPRDALATVFVDGDIIALGGTDGSNYLASCEVTNHPGATGHHPLVPDCS
jgi:hypothetical protein